MTKREVREHAREFALPVANKAESQEICFIPRGETARYLADRLPVRAGAVVDSGGRELGAHRGTALYTVGQRSGFGDLAVSGPWFVLQVDAASNRLVVGRKDELAVREVELRDVTFVDWSVAEPARCEARLRYAFGYSLRAPHHLNKNGDRAAASVVRGRVRGRACVRARSRFRRRMSA